MSRKRDMSGSLRYQRYIDAKEFETCKEVNGDDYLGEGSYGRVCRLYSTKLGPCAGKIFRVTGTVEQQKEAYHIVGYEANILSLINHENIVRFHGVACWSIYFAIIMDYEVIGSLHMLLKSQSVTVLPWKLRLRMVQETVKALVYLHHSGIDDRVVHGDLKSSNILLSEDLRIRVADFGAATIATKTGEQSSYELPLNARVHTVVFSAPEYLNCIFSGKSTAMDIFSLGRVIYELLTRKTPFFGQDTSNLTERIIADATPDVTMIPEIRQQLINSSDEDLVIVDQLVRLMDDCCQRNPVGRPNILKVQSDVEEVMQNLSDVDLLKMVVLVLNQMNISRKESSPTSRIVLNQL